MKIRRLLLIGAMCGLMVMQTSAIRSQSANVFRASVDRLTANAGDTVIVSVHYTFTAPKAHNIRGYAARFSFDSTLIRVVDFITDSTASAGMGTVPNRTPPNAGLVALGSQEIDLTNPVLFKIIIAVNRQLSDTGFLLWNRAITLIDKSWGVDSIVEDDGWVRTPESNGHVVLTTPGIILHGESDGFTPDSVVFQLPILVSDVRFARMSEAVLQFVFDDARLAFKASRQVSLIQISNGFQHFDTAQFLVRGPNGNLIVGGDTIAIVDFTAIVGTDTACTALRNMRLTPIAGDAFLGNTIYSFDSICLFGGWKSFGVISNEKKPSAQFEIYPNPAQRHVAFRCEGFDERDRVRISVFDVNGKIVYRTDDRSAGWEIAPSAPKGVYEVVFEDFTRNVRSIQPVVVGP